MTVRCVRPVTFECIEHLCLRVELQISILAIFLLMKVHAADAAFLGVLLSGEEVRIAAAVPSADADSKHHASQRARSSGTSDTVETNMCWRREPSATLEPYYLQSQRSGLGCCGCVYCSMQSAFASG